MNKVAVFINPKAGQGKLTNIQSNLKAILKEGFTEVELYNLTKLDNPAATIPSIAADVDLAIAAGGDGTVHQLLNVIAPLDQRPAFAIIPGGTSNDFSRQINMSQDPLEACHQINRQQIKAIDIGKSNQDYFLNFWGIGLITQVSASVDRQAKQNMGRLAYYLRALQTIGEERPFHVTIRTDDQSIKEEAVMVIIGNGSYTGGMKVFFPEGSINDGIFEILVIKEASIKSLWSILQAKTKTDFYHDQGIITCQAKQIELTANPIQEIDCDGERGKYTPTTISVLPKHINMLIGEYSD